MYSVCETFHCLVTQPLFQIIWAAVSALFIAILLLFYFWYSANLSRAELNHSNTAKDAEVQRRARTKHMTKVVMPAVMKLVTAVRRNKKESVPADQAMYLLYTLIAICKDGFLFEGAARLLKSYSIVDGQPEIEDLSFKLWSYSDPGTNITTISVDWKGLENPFTLVIGL